ncbi:hypothetical protein LIER_04285 [Lithospermum erythrorhizon]|uniref:Zinc finger CCCH domain-containing protein 44 n=1 Tax=Lithospermum erythrorhizon TaxID=34254 RepID=A0AAV3P0W2_LITER
MEAEFQQSQNVDQGSAVAMGGGGGDVVVSGEMKMTPPPIGGGGGCGVGMGLIGSGEKRKRGRPPRGQSAVAKTPPITKASLEGEDVCFICFDGGSLVLCDKKGCPKAYHPTCIKRDEAFFSTKAKWNCGWHICSVCQKASHYMCYTCTYSLCKGCTVNADYVGIRGNMGFCSTCMRTIMMIENKDQANKELVQVDFDDKTSWEYLFKVYWIFLKERLSLTLDELTQAENPCKGVRSLACKRMLPDLHNGVNNRNGFLSSTYCEQLESKGQKDLVEPPNKDLVSENPLKVEELKTENDASNIVCNAWASKELLDFVAHMKDGDTSVLSQFDVQELLLKYIKKNNLRDPLKKSQIICDLRLMNLFGKTRVGHIEMLKLLEFHFLIKEDLQNTFIPAGIVETDSSHLGVEENNKSSLLTNKNKQRKTRKRIEVQTPQNNLDEYAAIDVHNINLIYLRRNLMENLTQDEKFLEKVIGSVVRIRISSSDQKQDIYRLVQVVGTNKVPAPYKVGSKTVDVVLEVLNLAKKEAIAIDSISNQEFSQDECRRLRQSIRCGLVKHLTVGDIQKKAMELLTARLDDCLEAEKLKLNHLRDRASEKGRKKEYPLQECVEKLQLLDTPEERQRRLSEIPEVHADPKMNPDYESEPDAGVTDQKQDEYLRSKNSEFGRSKHRQINGKRKVQGDGNINGQRGDAQKRSASNLRDQAVVRPGPEIPAATLATGSSCPVNDGETEKLWHYRDPNGNIQGPFSMVQLRKWSTTGYFPPNMRIWRIHEQKDSILLTDALNGQLPKAAHLLYNLSPQSKQILPASDNQSSDAKLNHWTDRHRRDSNQNVQPLQYNTAGAQLEDNNESRRIDVSGSMSSKFSASSGRHKEVQRKDLPSIGLKENRFPSGHTGVHHPLSSSNNGPLVGSPSKSAIQSIDGQPDDKKHNKSHQSQSSGQIGRSFPINLNSSEMDLNSGSPLASAGSCIETGNTETCEPFKSTLRVNSLKLELVADVKLQSLNPKIHPQSSDIPSLPSPTPETPNENPEGKITESKDPQPGNGMFQDSGHSLSSGSSLVVGSLQLPDKTDDWGRSSPTPAKPNGEGWSSGPVSVSLLKQPDVVGDHATPISIDAPAHNSPSHITSNVTSWHGETIEFTTLAEESVSDLLAEVDAMESRTGLGSPTSTMRCGDEMKGFKNDCFSIDDLDLTLDPGKGDAWSSTGDIQVSIQSIATKDTCGVSGIDVYDPLTRSSRHSSSSSDGETRSVVFSHNQSEAGSASHPCPSRNISRDLNGTAMPPGNSLESLEKVTTKTGDHKNMAVEPSAHRVADVFWDSNEGTGWENPNMDRGTISGYGGHQFDGHRRYDGQRHPSSVDWASQGGEDRLLVNRQPLGGEGGLSKPPTKG